MMHTTKKWLCLLLACLLLGTAFLLSACGGSDEDTSADGADEAKPLTKQEQLDGALQSCKNFLTDALGGMEFTTVSAGLVNTQLTLESLTVAGNPLLGTDPLGVQVESTVKQNDSKNKITFRCMGDTVLAEAIEKDGKLYLDFPEVLEQPFRLTEVKSDQSDLFGVLESYWKELYDPEKDLAITETESGKVYTITIGADKLADAADRLPGLLENSPLGGLLGFLGEETAPDDDGSEDSSTEEEKLYFTLTMNGDMPVSAVLTAYEGTKEAFKAELLTSRSGSVSDVSCKITADAETILDAQLKCTSTEKNTRIEAKVTVSTVSISADVTVAEESETKNTLSGSITLSIDRDGMIISIPITLSGANEKSGKTVKSELRADASIKGVLEFAIVYQNEVTEADVTVDAPANVQPTVPDNLADLLADQYPATFELLRSLFGQEDDAFGYYESEDLSVSVQLYNSEIALNAFVDLKDNGSSLDFYSASGKKLCSFPYQIDNGTIHICGIDMDLIQGEDADFPVILCYEVQDVLYYEIDLHANGKNAAVYLWVPMQIVDNAITFTLPDGTPFPVPILITDEGLLIGDTLAVYQPLEEL